MVLVPVQSLVIVMASHVLVVWVPIYALFQKVAQCSDGCLCIVKSGGVVFNKRLDVRVVLVQLCGSVQELWKEFSFCRPRDHLGEVFSTTGWSEESCEGSSSLSSSSSISVSSKSPTKSGSFSFKFSRKAEVTCRKTS